MTNNIKNEFGDISEEKYEYNIIQKKLNVSLEGDSRQNNFFLIDKILKKLGEINLCSYYFQNNIYVHSSHYCSFRNYCRVLDISLEKRMTWLIKQDYDNFEKFIEIEKYSYMENLDYRLMKCAFCSAYLHNKEIIFEYPKKYLIFEIPPKQFLKFTESFAGKNLFSIKQIYEN